MVDGRRNVHWGTLKSALPSQAPAEQRIVDYVNAIRTVQANPDAATHVASEGGRSGWATFEAAVRSANVRRALGDFGEETILPDQTDYPHLRELSRRTQQPDSPVPAPKPQRRASLASLSLGIGKLARADNQVQSSAITRADPPRQSTRSIGDEDSGSACGGRFLIDPRTSKLMGRLDVISLLALTFTALVTPMEVAFLPPPTEATEPLFIANRIVDFIFAVDIATQFCIMFIDDREGHERRWVRSHRSIAWRYLTSWFAIDVISTGLSALDFLELGSTPAATSGGAASAVASGGAASAVDDCLARASSSLSQLKALRVIRALRLIKLTRLVRASRLIQRWETRVSINYAMLALLRLVLLVLLYLHWSAFHGLP